MVGVSDGDTITILDDAKTQHKIRFAGIDAPEKGQAFGERSKQSLSALVFQKRVEARCHKKDRYGREVCAVYEGLQQRAPVRRQAAPRGVSHRGGTEKGAEAWGLSPPPDGRAWGHVMARARSRGLIVAVGYGPAASSNGSPKVLWAKLESVSLKTRTGPESPGHKPESMTSTQGPLLPGQFGESLVSSPASALSTT